MKARLSVGLAASFLILSLAHGQAPAPAPAPATNAPPRDFGKAFERLRQIGLPDTQGGTYMSLRTLSGQWRHRGSGGLHSGLGVQGNAWLLRTNEAGQAVFILDGLYRVEVTDHKLWSEQLRKQMAEEMKKAATNGEPRSVRFDSEDDAVLTGQWRPADARKDLAKLMESLGEGDASPKGQQREMMSRYLLESAGPQTVLLAAQFHRQGFTNEANRLMEQLNARSRDSRQLIVQAVGLIADAQYDAVYASFQRTNDWAKYEAGLRDLGARFSSGWPNGPLMGRLADLVKQRAENPEPPELAGPGLTDEDRALARELALRRPDGRCYVRDLWVLPQERDGSRGSNILQRITARGLASVPLLLALYDDPYLTLIPRSEVGGHVSYSSSDTELSDEELERRFDGMERPARRCDIARKLLASVVPMPDERRYGSAPAPDELRDEVVAWYAAASNKAPAALQALYLEQGGQYQRQEVIGSMVSGLESNSDVTAIERFLLEGDDPVERYSIVQQYVAKRGAAAKAFVDQYVARVEKWEPEGEMGEEYAEMRKKSAASMAESLKRMASGAGTAAVLAEVLKNDVEACDSGELYQALSREAPSNALVLVLQAAGQATNVATRQTLVSSLEMLKRMAGRGPDGQYVRGAQAQVGALADHAALWRPLLADARMATEETPWSQAYSVSQQCCLVIEGLYGKPEETSELDELAALGTRGLQFVCDRAAARLAGTPVDQLAGWPSADSVTEEQRTALAARLLGSKSLANDLAALSLSELLALAGMCRDRADLAQQLRPLSLTVSVVDAKVPTLPGLAAPLAALKGQALDSNTIATLRKLCESVVVTGRAVRCMAVRLPNLAGVRVSVVEFEPSADGDDSNPFSFGGGEGLALSAFVQSEDQSGHALWRIETPAAPAAAKPAEPAEGSDELDVVEDSMSFMYEELGQGEEQFWEAIRQLGEDVSPCGPLWLMISGQPPVKPKDGEEGDGAVRRVYRSSSFQMEF